MNIILFKQTDYFNGSTIIRLSDRRFDHIIKVIRPETGGSLKVGMINGMIGTGRVVEITGDHIDISVKLENDPPLPAPVTLLMALPRPKVFRRVLKLVTTLGIKNIYLINAWRVEKSYWQTPLLKEESIREIFHNGLEQASDTIMPELHIKRFFKPFVDDELPDIVMNTTPLLAHPRASEKITVLSQGPYTLAIGPEGGFIEPELRSLKECGFKEVNFGERILNVEAAVPFIVSRLIP